MDVSLRNDYKQDPPTINTAFNFDDSQGISQVSRKM